MQRLAPGERFPADQGERVALPRTASERALEVCLLRGHLRILRFEGLRVEDAGERRHLPAALAVVGVNPGEALERELGSHATGALDLTGDERFATRAREGPAGHPQRADRLPALAAAARRHVPGDNLVDRLCAGGGGERAEQGDARQDQSDEPARHDVNHRCSPGSDGGPGLDGGRFGGRDGGLTDGGDGRTGAIG